MAPCHSRLPIALSLAAPHLAREHHAPARKTNPNAQKDIEGLIRLFEMQAFIDNFPNQASIGQRQRVALARALIQSTLRLT